MVPADLTRGLDAVIAIHRWTRRGYFLEFARSPMGNTLAQSTGNCYSCHASGLRAIRTYSLPKVDAALLDSVNRRILAYGAANFGPSVVPARLGPPLDVDRCVDCHDGRTRGRLYQIHMITIATYVRRRRPMPPADPLDVDAANELINRHFERWKEWSGVD